MEHARESLVPMLFTAVGVAGAVALVATGGSSASSSVSPLVFVGLVCVTGLAGVLAVLSWRPIRALAPDRSITAQWWKLVATGTGGLLAAVILEGATDISAWYLLVATVLSSILAIGAGVALGVAHLAGPVRSRRTTA